MDPEDLISDIDAALDRREDEIPPGAVCALQYARRHKITRQSANYVLKRGFETGALLRGQKMAEDSRGARRLMYFYWPNE